MVSTLVEIPDDIEFDSDDFLTGELTLES